MIFDKLLYIIILFYFLAIPFSVIILLSLFSSFYAITFCGMIFMTNSYVIIFFIILIFKNHFLVISFLLLSFCILIFVLIVHNIHISCHHFLCYCFSLLIFLLYFLLPFFIMCYNFYVIFQSYHFSPVLIFSESAARSINKLPSSRVTGDVRFLQ
jgi:hypothetical protein